MIMAPAGGETSFFPFPAARPVTLGVDERARGHQVASARIAPPSGE